MQPAGQNPFPSAVFSHQQHRGLRRGDPGRQLHCGLHLRGFRFQYHFRDGFLDERLQLLHLPAQAEALGQTVNQMSDLLRGERLGQIIPGPPFDGLHRSFNGGIGRNHDDMEMRADGQNFGNQVQAAHFLEAQVQESQIKRLALQRRQGLDRVPRRMRRNHDVLERPQRTVGREQGNDYPHDVHR